MVITITRKFRCYTPRLDDHPLGGSNEKRDVGHQVHVGIDRIQIAGDFKKKGLPNFAGFELHSDRFLRKTMPIRAWRRLARYEDANSGAEIRLQHQVDCSWLPAMKATVIAGCAQTLTWEIVQNVFSAFQGARITLLELPFDFPFRLKVDRDFVLRHGIFGKSRRRPVRFSTLYYGSRESDKLIRAYHKPEVSAFRIEFEFHASWLLRNNLTQPTDLLRLPTALKPYLNFSEVDWSRLENYLLVAKSRKDAMRILREARGRSADIHELLLYLREKKILNTHRLIRPLSINKEIFDAANDWARNWTRHV
jgi:hypothetical protein